MVMGDNLQVLLAQALIALTTLLGVLLKGRTGVRDARAEAKHQINNAVMVAMTAVNSVRAPSSEIEDYRRAVLDAMSEHFEHWKRD